MTRRFRSVGTGSCAGAHQPGPCPGPTLAAVVMEAGICRQGVKPDGAQQCGYHQNDGEVGQHEGDH
ncbi:hypothetical protein ACTG2V_22165 [Aeromonas sp. 74A]